MTRRGAGRERPGRELDDEGARAGEATVLPARGSSRRNREAAVAHPREPCVEAGGLLALGARAHERLRLVEPDCQSGLNSQNEAAGDPRLRLGQRLGPRIGEIPTLSLRPPSGRPVAVQIDPACVLANVEPEAVRVEVMDDPDVGVRRDRAAREEARHSGSRALVAMNTADDEDASTPLGIAQLERVDRAAAYRVPEELSVLHRRGGKYKADEGLDHHEGYGTVARQVPVTGM
jgi:hypothetical protein